MLSFPSNIFFFQAEDGIRDYKVTGVQTCALPISMGFNLRAWLEEGVTPREITADNACTYMGQIGRASCRERGWIAVGGVQVSKAISQDDGSKLYRWEQQGEHILKVC